MPKKDIIKYALLNSLWTAMYVILIVLFISFAGQIFGEKDTILIPMAMLLLFVFSAALCGALVLGRPILWYVEGKKQEAVRLFIYTVAMIFVVLVFVFGAMIVVK